MEETVNQSHINGNLVSNKQKQIYILAKIIIKITVIHLIRQLDEVT